MRPTPRQIELLEAIVITGKLERAAGRLGMTYGAARVLAGRMHKETGLETAQLIAIGLAEGWLTVRAPIEGRL